MNLLLMFLAVLFFSMPVAGALNPNSAARLEGESFQQAFHRHRHAWNRHGIRTWNESATPYSVSTPFEALDTKTVPVVEDYWAYFRAFRDVRFLFTGDRPEFPRRASWLYPHDGCWIRAELAAELAGNWNTVRPAKLFIFGTLSVATKNAAEGSVSWWYHVVPIVKDKAGQMQALDPAIDPGRPMPVKDWILTMVADIKDARYALCDSYAYGPFTPCQGNETQAGVVPRADIQPFLSYEWNNLLSLGRDPEKELGEYPPWLEPSAPLSKFGPGPLPTLSSFF